MNGQNSAIEKKAFGLVLDSLPPQLPYVATDLSEDAIELPRENIQSLQLFTRMKEKQGDLLPAYSAEADDKNMDLIDCNPPNILISKADKMEKGIATNEQGLAFYGKMAEISIIQKLIREPPIY